MGPVTGEDGVDRCPWAGRPGPLRDYHDAEWGVRVRGEDAYFERLTLEAFQSGLSWSTILAKRPAFRAAFAGFDVAAVAGFDDDDRARLLADSGIVRNRSKIDAAITNARAVLALPDTARDDEPTTLEAVVAAHAPAVAPEPADTETMATTSAESLALSKHLKRRGFTFVGPTTMYALMEALGIFDPHLLGCHRRGAGGGVAGVAR